jgi:F-type H+-transporting ATPase subunit a
MSSTQTETSFHAPAISWDFISGWSFSGLEITNTVFSTWIFMVLLFLGVAYLYKQSKSTEPNRIQTATVHLLGLLDTHFSEFIGSTQKARPYFVLFWGAFVFIFFSNVFGLMLDWVNMWSPAMHTYFRPINADLATTLVLAATVVIFCQWIALKNKGLKHVGHYLWNFHGESLFEKIINVPIGYLHLISECMRVLSLSMRLFANIFAGIILIGVMTWLGSGIPSGGTEIFGILALPFWFFELLVAFLQAFIFYLLGTIYLQESLHTEEAHH